MCEVIDPPPFLNHDLNAINHILKKLSLILFDYCQTFWLMKSLKNLKPV